MKLFRLFPALFLLAACGKDHIPDNELPINAVALSRVSNLLADRETYWWTASGADTVNLFEGVQYGASITFYHIQGPDTTNVTEQVLKPEHKAFLFWEPSDTTVQVEVRSGHIGEQGLNAFLRADEAGKQLSLSLTLRYQADTATQSGVETLLSAFPVVVK